MSPAIQGVKPLEMSPTQSLMESMQGKNPGQNLLQWDSVEDKKDDQNEDREADGKWEKDSKENNEDQDIVLVTSTSTEMGKAGKEASKSVSEESKCDEHTNVDDNVFIDEPSKYAAATELSMLKVSLETSCTGTVWPVHPALVQF